MISLYQSGNLGQKPTKFSWLVKTLPSIEVPHDIRRSINAKEDGEISSKSSINLVNRKAINGVKINGVTKG